MISETEQDHRDLGTVMIGDKVIDFAEIFSQGGSAHIEKKPKSGKFIDIEVSEKKIHLRTNPESQYHFRAEIDMFGALVFNIFLRDADGHRHPDLPHAAPLVDLAIKFLEMHQLIKLFTATWETGSYNLTNFYEKRRSIRQEKLATNQPVDEDVINKEAALQTWTGKNIAQKYGFRHVLKVDKFASNNIDYVIVKFSR